jgi:hypothetical protein
LRIRTIGEIPRIMVPRSIVGRKNPGGKFQNVRHENRHQISQEPNRMLWFFAQIVENRETQLSSAFLGPGDNFPKSYDENQMWSECTGGKRPRGIWCMIVGIEPARVSRAARARGRTRSGFRHNFSKNCPQDLKMVRGRLYFGRPLRFSTICAKNQVLKLKIDKVTVILRPFLGTGDIFFEKLWQKTDLVEVDPR